jgi:pentatricopeptide repeat protein
MIYDAVINSMASNGRINEELERIWKEMIMA